MNFEQARFNMIEQQVRPWDVLDARVLSLMSTIPREDFVPQHYRKLAFADTNIPLGHGEFMMPPREEGRILQALDINATDSILEVGTGSGYMSALLAKSGSCVHSIDINDEFCKQAKQLLAEQGIDNIKIQTDDALRKAFNNSFDVICITGAVDEAPAQLLQQLKIGGRAFVIIGSLPAMHATLYTRCSDDQFQSQILYETQIPYLQNGHQANDFEF